MLVQQLYQFINSPYWFSGLIIMVTIQNTYTIMILDEEEDILTLYSDYLSNMGHSLLSRKGIIKTGYILRQENRRFNQTYQIKPYSKFFIKSLKKIISFRFFSLMNSI